MDQNDIFSLILYHGRTRSYHSMQKAALDGLTKYPMYAAFRLYNGFALVLCNRVQEGIRELNPLKNDSELGLGAILALIYSHLRCVAVDRDAVLNLEQRLKEGRNLITAKAAYYAATFHFFTGHMEKAREYSDQSLKLDSSSENTTLLKAWIELFTQKSNINENILHTFEQALSQRINIDAALGQVRYFQLRGEFDKAISVLNKVSVRFPELSIPLIEKMHTQVAALEWDQAAETVSRIVNLEPSNISALRVKALNFVCREANFKSCASDIQNLLITAERVETGNFFLILHICQLFSRIASRNQDVLSITLRYVEKIAKTNPGTVEFVTELGYQYMMIGKINESINTFRKATKKDKNCFNALCGMTLVQLLNNSSDYDENTRQIEFLTNLKDESTTDNYPLLLLLKAKIADQDRDAIELLIAATEYHLKRLESEPFGTEYLRLLNPDFLLLIVEDLLRYSPLESTNKTGLIKYTTGSIHITFKHCLIILEIILYACPAHTHATIYKAKVERCCGDLSRAVSTLQKILNNTDSLSPEAYLLLAEIQIEQENFASASQSLEIALSLNFQIRKFPMYHLLLGIVQRKLKNQVIEARKSFFTAMKLIGSPFIGTSVPEDIKKLSPSENIFINKSTRDFTVLNRVTLYLELINTYMVDNNADSVYEGERLLQCAMDEFGNTTEKGRIIIANAEIMLRKCNVSKAINLLTAVQHGHPYYTQAKTRLAQIYLDHRKDRVAFANCFRELVQACPDKDSYLMLGEAFMSIQEPDLAVEAYQIALNINPNDSLLSRQLGRAFVKAHQYTKAIKYYKEALKFSEDTNLKLDLAELFLKLKQYNNATEMLSDDVDTKNIEERDDEELQKYTKQLLLLSRIYEKCGNIMQSLQTLQKARDVQYRLQQRSSVDSSGNITDKNNTLSRICLLMAQQSINIRDTENALKYYKECLVYNSNNIQVLTSMAHLLLQTSSMDLCRDVCVQILQIESNNEEASVMMADLSFRKMDFENAAYHFSQLLLSQPCYWTALARLIEVMRRSGSLNDVVPFLARAENEVVNSQIAGYNYCKGLFEWYRGNPNGALRNFNAVRRDYEWGRQAIFNMIEICINPDGDTLIGGDVQDSTDSGDFSDSRVIALKTAERLLKELRPRTGEIGNEALNYRLLKNFLLLASKQRAQIEFALQDFVELVNKIEFQNMVGPVLGLSTALVLLKQTQRAKNHLKRICRVKWNFEESEYLERTWLLLAEIYINSNKFETAEGFIEKVLEHNKSSTKAYELFGNIAEKTQNFREAVKHYQKAWICCGQSKPHIGYKLAHNYLKAKRVANAIDICQQVLKTHPDYVIIRKDVLEKCIINLRP